MRSLKSGLVAVAVGSLVVGVAVVGCSADGGGSDLGTETPGTEPTASGNQLPATAPPPVPQKDAGNKDSGSNKRDASVDAGPPPPNPGDPCTKVDETATRPCGACGTQQTLCQARDAGGPTWGPYEVDCHGQLEGGCVPNTTVTEACGNCGTTVKTCTKYCAYTPSTCTGEPADSCTPGATELSTASCTTSETYRQRSCGATCAWSSFSQSCSAPPTFVNVAPTVGSVNSSLIFLKATKTTASLSTSFLDACPDAMVTGPVTPYTYFQVKNPTATSAVVSIYHSQATGGPVIDTIMAAYAGSTVPSTATARKACTVGVSDGSNSALTGDRDFASLDPSRYPPSPVTIPAGGSVMVYSASFRPTTWSGPTTGALMLNVKTEQLN